MHELELVFWLSAGAVLYAYLGYPALLALVPKRRVEAPDGALPFLSVVVAAHDEEAVIAAKIANTLAQRYPEELLEVIVVSDGSTDGTEREVRKLAGPRVRLESQHPQAGKNEALNRGARAARGEVLVFTDANAMMAPDALSKLVAPFRDPEVGLTSGRGLYGRQDPSDPMASEAVSNAYVRLETFLKERESALGFQAAADGALYALRRDLYRPLAWNQVHDLMHPIQVALAGKRSVFVPEAFTLEPPSKNASVEFRRHVRIIAQGFLVFLGQAPRLAERGRLRELFLLVSHRPLRWSCWLFLAAALVSSGLLAASGRPFYAFAFGVQALFYAAALAGALGERFHLRLRLLAMPYYFCVVSLAGLSGLLQFLRGRAHASWASTGGS